MFAELDCWINAIFITPYPYGKIKCLLKVLLRSFFQEGLLSHPIFPIVRIVF